jgi:hypothetical protein
MFLSGFIINRFPFSKNYTLMEAASRVNAHNGLLAITFSFTTPEIEDIHHSHCCRLRHDALAAHLALDRSLAASCRRSNLRLRRFQARRHTRQMEVINVFDRKDASLMVGVIGNYFGGDAALVQFLRDKAANNPSFEVANHGLNH